MDNNIDDQDEYDEQEEEEIIDVIFDESSSDADTDTDTDTSQEYSQLARGQRRLESEPRHNMSEELSSGYISDNENYFPSEESSDLYDEILENHENLNYPHPDEYIAESQQIYEFEQEYLDSEKQNGKYYIGSAVLIRNRYYIMNTSITATTFMNFPISSILFYLYEFSLFYFVKNRIEIMKLHIHPVTMEYIVVLKTCWLRIVQRRWRRILRERAEVLRKRCSIANIQHRLVYGRHQNGLNVLPGLYGMLRQ
jgi:hypothetical protein